MPKHGENIRKRKDGRWEARYEKGRKTNGRIHYGYLYGKTYEEVRQKKLLILQKNHLLPVSEDRITMTFLCEEWKQATRYTVKDSSFASYDTWIDCHILPWFGFLEVGQLSSELIQQFSKEKIESGLAPRTVKAILILLKNILRYGEQKGYLSMKGIQFRYPRVDDQPLHILSDTQLHTLISYLMENPSRLCSGLLLCVYSGIRVGELCGLKCGDIDFQSGIMKIRRTVSRIKNLDYDSMSASEQPKTVVITGTPKSASSFREIPIPDFLLKILAADCRNPEDFLLSGSPFCMEPRSVQRKFQNILKKCGLPVINIHALRHGFATRCTEMGFDSKTLSEILGHSSAKITMDIYVHSSIQKKRTCMNKLTF